MFIVVKFRQEYLYFLLLLLLTGLFLYWHYRTPRLAPVQALLPLFSRTVAIDPGHGGYDPGAISNRHLEKDMVLAIALYLRDYLQQGGARVIMTRDRDKDFLETGAGPKKRLDMRNRLKIVEDGRADLLLSIHANYITSPRWRGSQVFFQEDSAEGQALAQYIQRELVRVLRNTDRQAGSGDYYMLRESSMTGVVVEVGFLSNPQEAELLASPPYQRKLAWAVYLGLIAYLANH